MPSSVAQCHKCRQTWTIVNIEQADPGQPAVSRPGYAGRWRTTRVLECFECAPATPQEIVQWNAAKWIGPFVSAPPIASLG